MKGEVRQRNVALILARELAVNLATPMWIWDEEGTLAYMNEPAEAIVGRRQQDLGTLHQTDFPQFQPEDLDGNPIDPSQLPSAIALRERRATHRVVRIMGLDGVKRTIEGSAFPLFTRGDQFVGAVSLFWELPGGSA
jgi:PAS domain-containing protein